MTTPTPRFDSYRNIHMALRACMTETLLAVGRMDPRDEAERNAVLPQVRVLLAICRSHLKKEETFVHPAMETRAPGSAKDTAGDHAEHMHWFQDLEDAVTAAESGDPAKAFLLYRNLALFVGENFVHMHTEETVNNEILWRTHSDAEIIAIEQAIVASLSPEEKSLAMRWMLPALSPEARAQMLGMMKAAMPPEAFAGILAMLKPLLSEANWRKLTKAMDSTQLAA